MSEDVGEIPPEGMQFPVWWTHCPNCDVSMMLRHEDHDLVDPDETDGFIECPYCESSMTGWNGDLR